MRALTETGEGIVADGLAEIETLLATENETDFDTADALAGSLAEALLAANVPHSLVHSFKLPEYRRASRYVEREFVSAVND